MSVISKVRDRVQSPVLVKCLTGFGNNNAVYDPGECYLLPAGEAAEFARAGFVKILPATGLESELAKLEIGGRA